MKPVDCHCHLNFEQFKGDFDEVIKRAREKLEFLVCAGCDLETNREVLKLSEKYESFIVPTLGLHPTFQSSFDDIKKVKEQIRKENPVAIGEIGLDHHHVTEEKERKQQRKVFEEMVRLAEEMGKPVVVHSREAESQCIEILASSNVDKVMMHCFNGTVEQTREAVDNGFKIGVTTQLLYSSRVEDIVEELDVEDILLETDSPFLYPEETNEPSNVTEIVNEISEIKSVNKEELVEATGRNAREMFRPDYGDK